MINDCPVVSDQPFRHSVGMTLATSSGGFEIQGNNTTTLPDSNIKEGHYQSGVITAMALEDTVCTLVPYFTVQDGKLDEFKALGGQMVQRTQSETGVVFYGFSFSGQRAHCREGYRSAAGVLAHLENVDSLLKQALEIASLDILEVHGPADQLAELQEPLKGLNPAYFTMETGFRR